MKASEGITQAQLKKVWAAAGELGWSDDHVHEELERVIGVRSLRDLSQANASLFISYLVSEGATPGRGYQGGHRAAGKPNVITMASPAQRDFLAALVRGLRLTEDAPYYLAIVTRAIGHSKILTMEEASTVIGILRKLETRCQGSAPGNMDSSGRGRSKGA